MLVQVPGLEACHIEDSDPDVAATLKHLHFAFDSTYFTSIHIKTKEKLNEFNLNEFK